MAGHAQLKFVMTECSKTQIRLTQLISQLISYQVTINTGESVRKLFIFSKIMFLPMILFEICVKKSKKFKMKNGLYFVFPMLFLF